MQHGAPRPHTILQTANKTTLALHITKRGRNIKKVQHRAPDPTPSSRQPAQLPILCDHNMSATQIFADDVTEEKGENARLSAFVGAIAVGDLVSSTLGPKGMDKILQSA